MIWLVRTAESQWGLVGVERGENKFLFSGLEAVRRQNNSVTAKVRRNDKQVNVDQNMKVTDWFSLAKGR